MKQFIAIAVCLFWASVSVSDPTQVMVGVDDNTYHVELGHDFPYYGGVFTDAWMSSNGFILLYDPVEDYGNSLTYNNLCCNGYVPRGQPKYSYMIAPFWTDVMHDTSVPDSGYFYETGEDGTFFEWRNLVEYAANDNINTFGLQLWPDGSFDFHYEEIDITLHSVWVGFTGDATNYSDGAYEEVNQLYYRNVVEDGATTLSDVSGFADEETNYGYSWYGDDGGYQ